MQQPPKILVVDDEENMRFFLTEALIKEKYDVVTAANGLEALEKVQQDYFDVVIMDVRMNKMNGVEALETIKEHSPLLPVIMMTAYGSKKIAMEAVEKGAYDYFTKPFDLDEMRIVIKHAVEKQKLEKEIKNLKTKLGKSYHFEGIIGTSTEMQDVFDLVHKVINNDITVIIYGESGTGKELIATIIHENSPRKNGPLVKINCAAIPDTLLESELFGYEKGAFTGAGARKAGKFEMANGGTLFLDEIGDMALATQSKLLRVLEERKFERLGGTESVKVDIRIIAATNQDLPKAISEKRFREDLYFRLNVIPIFMPPLRERLCDIPLLAEYFLSSTNEKLNKNVKGFSKECMEIFLNYRWPGNVREFENIIQRATVITQNYEDIIKIDDLPENLKSKKNASNNIENDSDYLENDKLFTGSLPDLVEKITENTEKRIISETLSKTNWSRSKTAELLKICRKSLHNKMKKYGLFSHSEED